MTRSTIGGQLDLAALNRLAGGPDSDCLRHFATLDRQQQAHTIRRLANLGWSESVIAATTLLNIEQVRRVLAEPHPGILGEIVRHA